MQKEHHGVFYGLVAALASAIGAVCIKMVDKEVPFNTMVFIRFFIALLFVLPAIVQGKVHLHFKFVPKHILRGLMGLAAIYGYFYSVIHLPLVNAVTLSNTTPLFMPIVIFFWLRLIIPKLRLFALIVGFVGVIFILRPHAGMENLATFIGLGGALCSAFALIGIRQLSKTESTETIMAYYFVISLVVLLIPTIVTWKPVEGAMNWLYLGLMGLSSVIYQFTLTKALYHSPATKISTLSYLSVAFSGLFGWWVFNEIPDVWVLIGVAIIIAGGLMAIFCKESARHWGKTK